MTKVAREKNIKPEAEEALPLPGDDAAIIEETIAPTVVPPAEDPVHAQEALPE